MKEFYISNTVREYVKKTGFRFRDSDLATLSYHFEVTLSERHCALKRVCEQTTDQELKQQIKERIAFDERCIERFKTNDGGCFYETSIDAEDGVDEITGHFATVELAWEHARGGNVSFYIKKYQILGLRDHVITAKSCMNPRLFPEMPVEELPYCGDPISTCAYNADGEIAWYDTLEISDAERDAVNDWGKTRFEDRFVPVSNPFERGDIVCMASNPSEIGVVATSQAEWKEFLRRVKEQKNLVVDFIDASIIVEFPTQSSGCTHEHISPLLLERVELDETDERKRVIEAASYLLKGQGTLSVFLREYHKRQKEKADQTLDC